MWCLQDDETQYGRIRGKIAEHHQASCIGGCIFEYSDEWWKGSKGDTWHTGVCPCCSFCCFAPVRLPVSALPDLAPLIFVCELSTSATRDLSDWPWGTAFG